MADLDIMIIDVQEVKDKRKLYNDRYTTKHLAKLSSIHNCEICKGKYSLYNKSHHFQTKKHINSVQVLVVI